MEELNQLVQIIIDKQIKDGVEFNIPLAITTINNYKNELDFDSDNKSLIKKIGDIQGYLKYCDKNGFIHGKVNIHSTNERFSHSEPNLGGVNSKDNNIRKLFKTNIGIDAKAIELRLLAHYLYPYDNGEYSKQILESDIHEYNRVKAGIDTRKNAKEFIYTLNYGGGDKLLSEKLNCNISDVKTYRKKFNESINGYVEFKNNLPNKLFGIVDIKLENNYKDLNIVLQTSASIVMKSFLVILNKKLNRDNIDFKFVLNVHDEIQIVSNESEKIRKIVKETEILLTSKLKLKCKIEFDFKVGENWSETH